MRKLLLIFFLLCVYSVDAQDKIFYKNGTSRKGILVTVAKDYVYFKTSDTSQVEKISKTQLLLLEDYKGNRYLFAEKDTPPEADKNSRNSTGTLRNSFGIQPLSLFFGRATCVYERLSENQKIGVAVPLILTFNPYAGGSRDSSQIISTKRGVNIITGIDVNFYFGKKEKKKYFIGPRFRYGTDLFFSNIEGLTLQTQFGIRVGRPEKRFSQHLSFGFGFARIISAPVIQIADPKQSYPWYSINYRLSLKW
jgi:hypothetical protein